MLLLHTLVKIHPISALSSSFFGAFWCGSDIFYVKKRWDFITNASRLISYLFCHHHRHRLHYICRHVIFLKKLAGELIIITACREYIPKISSSIKRIFSGEWECVCVRTTGVVFFIFPSYSTSHLLYFYYTALPVLFLLFFLCCSFCVLCLCVCDHFLWFEIVLVKREGKKGPKVKRHRLFLYYIMSNGQCT